MPPRHATVPKLSRPPVSPLFLVLLLALLAAACAYYWFTMRQTPDKAAEVLAAQNIEVSPTGFLGEIKAGHINNIHSFLQAGAQPGTQNDDGVSALMTGAETDNKEVVNALLAGLPATPQDAANMVNLQDTVNGKTALLIASEKGNADIVKALLDHGADTGLADKSLATPLIAAVKNKHQDVLPLLIKADKAQHNGVTVNLADMHGETALTYAIRLQSKDMADVLLAAGADIVTPDRGGVLPLMIAAEAGDVSIGERLIEMGAKLNVADRSGNTPLTIAIRHAHPEFARMLLDKGADPDFHTNGPSPLEAAIAAENFDAALFSYLLERSKETNHIDASVLFEAIDNKKNALAATLLTHGVNARAVNGKGETLLYRAIENDLEDDAVLLIDKGADIRHTGVPGGTPLERAAKRNEYKVVSKLLSLGVSAEQKTSEGYTLAEMAIYSGYPEVLDALLAHGARAEKDFGILWAIRDGKGKAVPVLLKYGAHPNVMSSSGEPALWLAASMNEVEAVAALIGYHAIIDHPNTAQSMTPLAVASHAGQLASVKLLVEAGARLEAADAFGMTPLAHAAYMSKPDVVEYLLDKGANAHATDKQGRSIMDLAALGENSAARDRVITLLQQK